MTYEPTFVCKHCHDEIKLVEASGRYAALKDLREANLKYQCDDWQHDHEPIR